MTFGDPREHPTKPIDMSTEPCAVCKVPTIAESAWREMGPSARKASGAKRRNGGRCLSCARGHKPQFIDPEPGEEFVEPQCKSCGHDMVTRKHWAKADHAERQELREEGYKVLGNEETGLCRQCLSKAKQEAA